MLFEPYPNAAKLNSNPNEVPLLHVSICSQASSNFIEIQSIPRGLKSA
jgi:hypothetical protein